MKKCLIIQIILDYGFVQIVKEQVKITRSTEIKQGRYGKVRNIREYLKEFEENE